MLVAQADLNYGWIEHCGEKCNIFLAVRHTKLCVTIWVLRESEFIALYYIDIYQCPLLAESDLFSRILVYADLPGKGLSF